ncbi:MAG: hypothetical protein MHMPM18_003537 [Marteilia pararefringens]
MIIENDLTQNQIDEIIKRKLIIDGNGQNYAKKITTLYDSMISYLEKDSGDPKKVKREEDLDEKASLSSMLDNIKENFDKSIALSKAFEEDSHYFKTIADQQREKFNKTDSKMANLGTELESAKKTQASYLKLQQIANKISKMPKKDYLEANKVKEVANLKKLNSKFYNESIKLNKIRSLVNLFSQINKDIGDELDSEIDKMNLQKDSRN